MYRNACGTIAEDCNNCPYNAGIEEGSARIAGPCGQQNCWFSCTVCRHNNMQTCDIGGEY
ncbi:MAG: hypothetical protein PHO01_13250 [Desulfotomaculaceae bacterium]|nr:hypothetical protein [Desulfotomaculaceae bacterium]